MKVSVLTPIYKTDERFRRETDIRLFDHIPFLRLSRRDRI